MIDVSAPDPREEKLPKWAQQELFILRSNLDSARKAAYPEDFEANTFVRDYSRGDRPIGFNTPIKFYPDDSLGTIEVRVQDGRVNVRTDGGRLIIRPDVSNVIWIEVDER